jgi:TonB family protein
VPAPSLATSAPEGSASGPRPPARSAVSPALILGGAAAFFVVAVGVAGFVVWRRSQAAAPPPEPPPVAEVQATAPPPTVVAITGTLRVETTPPGAAISVNGEARGPAPLDLAELPIGNYEVRAELRGYEPKTETVTIVESAPAADLKLVLTRVAPTTGTVEIHSEPGGAVVMVDGSRAGETPIQDLRLRPGSHKVDVAAEGYEPWSGSVTIEAGKKARVDAALVLIPKATPTPPPPPAVDPSKVYLNTAADVDILAKKISGATGSYPSGAPRLKSGDAVSVSVTFVVDANGDVDEVKVIESAGAVIDESVVKAIRKWKYSPAMKQGVKVKVKIAFKQTFRAG